jgi:hypothetical protein
MNRNAVGEFNKLAIRQYDDLKTSVEADCLRTENDALREELRKSREEAGRAAFKQKHGETFAEMGERIKQNTAADLAGPSGDQA